MQRVKVTEPVWSSQTGKESTRQDIARKPKQSANEKDPCANCERRAVGMCISCRG